MKAIKSFPFKFTFFNGWYGYNKKILLKITSAALCEKSLVHFKREKAKLQWKILWLWKIWGLQYFKPISSMKKHFNRENFQKFSTFSTRIKTKTVLKDSLVTKETMCQISL
jgi:hypothetical protein